MENLQSMEFNPDFRRFYNEIIDYSQTLPLILNNLKKIVSTLLEYIKIKVIRKEILGLFPSLFRDC